ncbi:EthD family reductase [Pendulispora albinea]|uniref:EthD family reductase n=1 Tax=Pendulispora albinea TaxID=2741071 RepID=A0ABZ2M755_9BACT
MIRVSVLYPAAEGKTFDHHYYTKKHMPRAGELLAPVRYEVDKGISGGEPGRPAPFVAACHFYFETVEHFAERTTVHGPELRADIANYTNIEPVIQISEIVS